MESVIGLRFSTPLSPSVRMPSGFHAARTTKPHSRLSRSSLSLPKTTGDRPLDHIIGPISCLVYGSLPPSDNREYRGAANVPWASGFRWNIGWGNRSNHKANKPPKLGHSPSSQPDSDKKRPPDQQFMAMVEKLKRSQHYDLAVALLRAVEPFLEEKEARKSISIGILYNQLLDIVALLKRYHHYDLAEILLKAFEAFDEEKARLDFIQFELMEILYNQGNYQEAFKYWIKLFNSKSMNLRKPLSSKMKSDLFATVTEVTRVILRENKDSDQQIPPDLLSSIDCLTKIDIPKLLNIPGADMPSKPPDEL